MSEMGLTRFLEKAASHRILSAAEEVRLARAWQGRQDESAREKLYLHNIRLVVSIARNFVNRGQDLEDLIQAGCVGLDTATRKFDPEKGYKFSTYASWWIRQAVQRSVAANGRTIRVPSQVSTRRLQIDALLREEPGLTYYELAERLKCTPAQVSRAMRTAEVVTSLDYESGSSTQTLLDTLPDADADDPADLVSEEYPELRAALETLPHETYRQAVRLRYGFGDGVERTVAEVAEEMGVTTSWVTLALRESHAHLRQNL